jgi:hypothetical protein
MPSVTQGLSKQSGLSYDFVKVERETADEALLCGDEHTREYIAIHVGFQIQAEVIEVLARLNEDRENRDLSEALMGQK